MSEQRLIDANSLKVAFRVDHPEELYDGFKGWDLIDIRKIIDSTPTVPAEVVVHGEWITKGNLGVCSLCGEYVKIKSHYCPDCGCRMEGGESDYVSTRKTDAI